LSTDNLMNDLWK